MVESEEKMEDHDIQWVLCLMFEPENYDDFLTRIKNEVISPNRCSLDVPTTVKATVAFVEKELKIGRIKKRGWLDSVVWR